MVKYGWHPGRNISEFSDIIFGQGLGAPLGGLLGNPILGIRLANALGCTIYLCAFWGVSLLFFPHRHRKTGIIFIIALTFFLPTISYTAHYMTLMVLGGYIFALLCTFIITHILTKDILPFSDKRPGWHWGAWLVLCYLGTQIVDTGYLVAAGVLAILLVYLGARRIFPKLFITTSAKYSKKITLASLIYFAYCSFALFRNVAFGGRAHSAALTPISFDIAIIVARFFGNKLIIDASLIVAAALILWLGIIFFRKRLKIEETVTFAMLSSGLAVAVFCSILGTYFDQAIWIIWLGILRFIFSCVDDNNKIFPIIIPTAAMFLIIGAFVITQPKFSVIRARYDYRNAEFFQKAEEKGLEILYLTDDELKYLNIGNYGGDLYPNPSSALVKIGILSKPIKIEPISKKPPTP